MNGLLPGAADLCRENPVNHDRWGPLLRKPSRDSQGCFSHSLPPLPHPGNTGSYPSATHSSGPLLGDDGDKISIMGALIETNNAELER